MQNQQEIIDFLEIAVEYKKHGKVEITQKGVIVDGGIAYQQTFDYTLLESCLKHDNHKVRLKTLTLLAESKKSVQGFSKLELNLILSFLQYNIYEKMEFAPLYKKILRRLNDSYLSIKKQLQAIEKTLSYEKENTVCQELFDKTVRDLENKKKQFKEDLETYKNFISGLNDFFESSIHLGAVNTQNFYSLQIICLMQEFLNPDLLGDMKPGLLSVIFSCMLVDTYEKNKELCFEIHKKAGVEKCGHIAPKRVEILELALKLPNNITPIDSCTASLLLKLLSFYPDFSDTLNVYKQNWKYVDSKIAEAEGNKSQLSMLKLVEILQDKLEVHCRAAEDSIVVAASKHSLYGFFVCLRSVLKTINLKKMSPVDQWRKAISDIIQLCFRLSKTVSQIVNNSSPEGHLPMDLNQEHLKNLLPDEKSISVTPQKVLLCSWHSIKEIGLLFGELAEAAPIDGSNQPEGLMNEDQLKAMGEHLVTLLCETKHRGAFEQVHVGFGMLCARLWRLQKSPLQELPKEWLKSLILEIAGLTSENNKLCATRRSAGVPFMVQALVTSEIERKKDDKNLVLHPLMRILIGLSQLEETEVSFENLRDLLFKEELFSHQECNISKPENIIEIKTHSLNILRALFRHCRLGDLIKDYLEDALVAAIKSSNGKCWAERNAASLLFGSLITRIFGVQRTKDHVNLTAHNRMPGFVFFERYPKLMNFMLEELRIFTADRCDSMKPGIQCVLLILSRLYPTKNSENDSKWKINEFVELTMLCGESRVFKTRELAARALAPLLTEQNFAEILSRLISTIESKRFAHNAAHGYMLQVLEIVKDPRFSSSEMQEDDMKRFLQNADSSILNDIQSFNEGAACFPLATTCLNVLIELLGNTSQEYICHGNLMDLVKNRTKYHLTAPILLKDRPGREIYEMTVLDFIMSLENARHWQYDKSSDLWVLHFGYIFHEIVTHDRVEVRAKAWLKLSVMFREMESTSYCYAKELVIKAMHETLEDRNLQNAIYEFLYTILYVIENHEKHEVAFNIVKWLILKLRQNSLKSGNFFKVLGKAFGALKQIQKDQLRKSEKNLQEEIYLIFAENSWMKSSSLECRLEISQILFELRIENLKEENYESQYYWWTTLLNLLLDDDATVRRNANATVSKIRPMSELQCSAVMLQEFFDKFADLICKKEPDLGKLFLFSWAFGPESDMDFDNDAFASSHNDEFFDPIKLSDYCLNCIKEKCRVEEAKTLSYVEIWEKYKRCFNLDAPFDDFFHQLRTCPVVKINLDNVTDPSFNQKLVRWKICEKFR